MNYEDMSDFGINKRVAIALGVSPLPYPHDADRRSAGVRHSDYFYEWFDYCNNPSDAWPIIKENKIGTREYDGYWEARLYNPEIAFCCKNPLRAAMIVFLMMQEAKRG